jgi:glycosyltransferase involved in cell wall biosynthesis
MIGPGPACLWLARTLPFPADSGDLAYSAGLADALGEAGAEVTFAGLKRPGAARGWQGASPRVEAFGIDGAPRPGWRALLSPLPLVGARHATPEYRDDLLGLLARRRWDAIVVDHYGMSWVLPHLARFHAWLGRRPPVVYVSHNHEAALTRDIARDAVGDPLRRALLKLNAAKVARAERTLIAGADLLSAITEPDAQEFLAERPDARIVVLSPGYAGHRAFFRTIDEAVPRRVVVFGSYRWTAKQLNLERLLEATDGPFRKAGVELLVVGTIADDFRRRLEQRYGAARFAGYVPEARTLLESARLGIVAEPTGGGFKLKYLDYVFHGLPVATLPGSMVGLPTTVAAAMIVRPDLALLAAAIVEAIDDLPRLNDLQRAAIAEASPAFEWADRGHLLRRAIEDIAARAPR